MTLNELFNKLIGSTLDSREYKHFDASYYTAFEALQHSVRDQVMEKLEGSIPEITLQHKDEVRNIIKVSVLATILSLAETKITNKQVGENEKDNLIFEEVKSILEPIIKGAKNVEM